jgi:hypothetical protein
MIVNVLMTQLVVAVVLIVLLHGTPDPARYGTAHPLLVLLAQGRWPARAMDRR